jgi:hypothetical protein
MYGSPIIGVHLSNSRRLFGPLGFFGHSFSHVLEVRFARFEIALYIDQYPNALIVLLIYDFLNEVLNRFKCLPSLTDQHAAVAAFNLEKNTLIIRFSADLSVVGNEINDPAQGLFTNAKRFVKVFRRRLWDRCRLPVPVPVQAAPWLEVPLRAEMRLLPGLWLSDAGWRSCAIPWPLRIRIFAFLAPTSPKIPDEPYETTSYSSCSTGFWSALLAASNA